MGGSRNEDVRGGEDFLGPRNGPGPTDMGCQTEPLDFRLSEANAVLSQRVSAGGLAAKNEADGAVHDLLYAREDIREEIEAFLGTWIGEGDQDEVLFAKAPTVSPRASGLGALRCQLKTSDVDAVADRADGNGQLRCAGFAFD